MGELAPNYRVIGHAQRAAHQLQIPTHHQRRNRHIPPANRHRATDRPDVHIVGDRGHYAGAPVAAVVPVAAAGGQPFVGELLDREVRFQNAGGHGVASAVLQAGGVYAQRVVARHLFVEGELQLPAIASGLHIAAIDHAAVRSDHLHRVGQEGAGVNRFREGQRHRAGIAAHHQALTDAAAQQGGRHRVGHQVHSDRCRQPDVAAGVGGAHLQRDRAAAVFRNRRQGCAQVERERHVVADHLAVDQHLDIAHLHVVADGGLQRDRGAFLQLQAWRAGLKIHGADRGADHRGHALVVEGQVVHHLQAACAVGDEGDARTDGDVHRRCRQCVSGDEVAGVGGFGNVHHVDAEQVLVLRPADGARGDGHARAVDRNGLALDVGCVDARDHLHRCGVGNVDGGEAARGAVAGADVGDAATHHQPAAGWGRD